MVSRGLLFGLVITLLLSIFLMTFTHNAKASSPGAVQVFQIDDSVLHVNWNGSIEGLPVLDYHGYQLPMLLQAMLLTDDQPLAPAIHELQAQAWNTEIKYNAPVIPVDVEPGMLMATPLDSQQPQLPTAPLFIAAEGRQHGVRIAVVALSPIYSDQGVVKFATHLQADLIGVASLPDDIYDLTQYDLTQHTIVRTAGIADALLPTNPAALKNAVKLQVMSSGIQRVTGAALVAAGIDLTSLNPAYLHLAHQGEAVALEIRDLNNNGKLEPNEEIRFYAPTIGDRFNRVSTYWLTIEEQPGLQMSTRSVLATDAPERTTAIERGVWEENHVYEPSLPGQDGDHWFAQRSDLISELSLHLTSTLPISSTGLSVYTATFAAPYKTQYRLEIKVGNEQKASTLDTTESPQPASYSLAVTTNVPSRDLKITVVPTSLYLYIEKFYWEHPIQLTFGSMGARFSGVAGTWRYRLEGLPEAFTLYDISNAQRPVVLTDVGQNFQDGPTPHNYMVAGAGTLYEPKVLAHTAVNFNMNGGANTIYITPDLFRSALQPLVEHRQQQGYKPTVVDVQTIYDAWSYGYVDPKAIRKFLRFTHAHWTPAPIAVVLVGDGTYDPHNYENQRMNPDFIPPYLADIDPWLGESACENCFVQLDGDDPLNNPFETPDSGFTPDMYIGRFPVKSIEELASVIGKLIDYEIDPNITAPWRNTSVFIADAPNLAGNFAKLADEIVALQPANITTKRLYYDPLHQGNELWYEPSAIEAHTKTLQLLDAGAGLVTFNGRANHWQWATTDKSVQYPYLFYLWDVLNLSNWDKPFIMLEMTSLTSAFAKPANNGMTLDEHLFLYEDGGAIATWGPSGLDLVPGPQALMQGFHRALWAAEPMTATLGQLVNAGYTNQRTTQTCCHDVLHGYSLLGDPLMPVRVNTPPNVPPLPPTGNYEPDNRCDLARRIRSDGISQTRAFDTPADVDWVRFVAIKDQRYRVEVQVPANATADVNLEMYTNCNGLPIDQWNATFTPEGRLDYTAPNTGVVYLRLANYNDAIAGSRATYQLTVRRMPAKQETGAVIIVAGRLKIDDSLQQNVDNVAQKVYALFLANGYTADNIYFLSHDSALPGHDAIATAANLRAAITEWAAAKVGEGRPLTLYLVDHGQVDKFYLDGPHNETISPSDLNAWLSELQLKVSGVIVNVIIEACYAGSFVELPQSISGIGRVIITSSDARWLATTSENGARFSDFFLTSLEQGRDLANSWWEARNFVHSVTPLQDPWLDANANSVANEPADYEIAARRGFAYPGTLTDDNWSPYIAAATSTTITNYRGLIEAEVRDDQEVDSVWAVVYPPSYQPPLASDELVSETLDTIVLQHRADGHYIGSYPGFTELGDYRIVIHAKDKMGLEAAPLSLIVGHGSVIRLPLIAR